MCNNGVLKTFLPLNLLNFFSRHIWQDGIKDAGDPTGERTLLSKSSIGDWGFKGMRG